MKFKQSDQQSTDPADFFIPSIFIPSIFSLEINKIPYYYPINHRAKGISIFKITALFISHGSNRI